MTNIACNFLKKNKIRFLTEVNLKEFTYLKTGGIAELVIYPSCKNELQQITVYFNSKSITYKVIGFTSNILFLDDHNYGILISLYDLNELSFNNNSSIIQVGAGKSLDAFVEWCIELGYAGFEGLEGIPGTLGGALTMNAGAYGYYISDLLLNVECLSKEGEIVTYKKEDLNYSFRNSFFKDNSDLIILKATFLGKKGDKFKLAHKKDLLHFKRHKYNDYSYPSLGSLFATFDLYSDIGKINIVYYFVLRIVLKVTLIKPLWFSKPIYRKLENAFTEWYFGFSFEIQPYSNKTLNSLLNRSQGTKNMLEYIYKMRMILKNSVEIENEILTSKFTNLNKEEDWSSYLK